MRVSFTRDMLNALLSNATDDELRFRLLMARDYVTIRHCLQDARQWPCSWAPVKIPIIIRHA